VAFAPGDLPSGTRLGIDAGSPVRDILSVVRPDITFVDQDDDTADGILASAVDWPRRLSTRRSDVLTVILPDSPTSDFDWRAFPPRLIRHQVSGALSVKFRDLEAWVAGLGTFFGEYVNGEFVHADVRYQPFSRITRSDRDALKQETLDLLKDDDSRADLSAVLSDQPRSLWKRWLSRLYDSLEYMDYASVGPGDVVLNCGVHGGGEIPFFLCSLAGTGQLINIDPLGHDYLSPNARASLSTWPAVWTECRAALHDCDGTVTLPVEPGGMAAGGLIGEHVPGLESVRFRSARIDTIVEELGLERLDLIKMDIEGAEPHALNGASESIRRFRPQLAISIYHRPEHFLEIPLQVAALTEDYDLFVKNYHFITNETLVYAIPRERKRRQRRRRVEVRLVVW
jgi:FkbM family methyltransferase